MSEFYHICKEKSIVYINHHGVYNLELVIGLGMSIINDPDILDVVFYIHDLRDASYIITKEQAHIFMDNLLDKAESSNFINEIFICLTQNQYDWANMYSTIFADVIRNSYVVSSFEEALKIIEKINVKGTSHILS